MPHAPNPMLVKLQALREAESPTVMTYDEALGYGVDLSGSDLDDYENWLVKFTSDPAIEGGLRLSYISPDNYEYLPGATAEELQIIDPFGKQWTRDEWNAAFQAYEEGQQAIQTEEDRESELLGLLRTVFADEPAPSPISPYGPYGYVNVAEPLLNFAQQSDETALSALQMWTNEAYSEKFITKIRAKGQTPETERLIQMLVDVPTAAAEIGQTEADFMAQIFGNIGPSGIDLVGPDNMPLGIHVDQGLKVWDERGATPVHVGMWDEDSDSIIPFPPVEPPKKEDKRGFFSKAWGTFESWIGDTAAQVKGAANWIFGDEETVSLGFPGMEIYNPAKMAEWAVPEWQVEKLQGAGVEGGGIGWEVARAIGPMIPLMVIGITTTIATGGAAAGALAPMVQAGTMSARMATLISTIAGAIGGGAASRISESMIEAGAVFEQAMASGKTEDEARRAANEVFVRNTRDLTMNDIIQYGVGMGAGKLLGMTALARLGQMGLIKWGARGGQLIFQGATEAFEEYYQEIIQRQALGEDISAWAVAHNLSDEDIRTVTLIGGILGMGMGGVFEVVNATVDKAGTNLPADALAAYQTARKEALAAGKPKQQAHMEGLAAAVEANPKAAESIAKLGKAVAMQRDLKSMKARTEQRAAELEEKARKVAPEVPEAGVTYNGTVTVTSAGTTTAAVTYSAAEVKAIQEMETEATVRQPAEWSYEVAMKGVQTGQLSSEAAVVSSDTTTDQLHKSLIAQWAKRYSPRRAQEVARQVWSYRERHRRGDTRTLHTNEKTFLSMDFDTICPNKRRGRPCFYCYVEHPRVRGFRYKPTMEFVSYDHVVRDMPQAVVDYVNEQYGGLRVFSFSDYNPANRAEWKQVFDEARKRGLQLKVITKDPGFIEEFADAYADIMSINLSIDTLPEEVSNAVPLAEARAIAENHPNVKIRIVCLTVDEALVAAQDPDVGVITLYHGVKGDTFRAYAKKMAPEWYARHSKEISALADRIENMQHGTKAYETAIRKLEEVQGNKAVEKVCCQTGNCGTCSLCCASGFKGTVRLWNAINQDLETGTATTPEGVEYQVRAGETKEVGTVAGAPAVDPVEQLRSVLDESRKGQSIYRLEAQLEKQGWAGPPFLAAELSADQTAALASLREALDQWHSIERKGKGLAAWRAQQNKAWAALQEALDGLSTAFRGESVTPTEILQETTVETETGEALAEQQATQPAPGAPQPVAPQVSEEVIAPAPVTEEEAALLLEEQQLWLDFLDQTGDVPISWDDITNPTIDQLWKHVGIDPKGLVAKIIEMRGQAVTKENPILARELQAALKELNKTQADLTKAIKERYELMLQEQKQTATGKLAALKQKFADFREIARMRQAKAQWRAQRRLSETERANQARQQVLAQRFTDKADFIADIKNDLRDYVQKHLPLRERGKMVAAIDNITTETQLEHELGRVERLAELHNQRVLRKMIVRLFKRTRLKKLPTVKYGVRIHADVQERLEYLRQHLGRNPEEIVAESRWLGELYEAQQITWDELIRGQEDLSFMGIQAKSADELQQVYDDLKRLVAEGRTLREKQVEAILAKMKKNFLRNYAVLVGGKKVKPTQPGAPAPKTPQNLWERIKSAPSGFLRGLATFEGTMDLLSQFHKASKQYASPLSKWAMKLVLRAQDATFAGSRAFLKADLNARQRIFKERSARKLGQMQYAFSHDVVKLGRFTDGYGVSVELQFTADQIMQIYQALKDPSLDKTFRSTSTRHDAMTDKDVPSGMGWTDSMMNAVNEYMAGHQELKEYADWQMQYWQDNYDRIDAVFSKIYGVHLPKNPFYSRITRDYQKAGEATPTPMSLIQAAYREASERNPSLRMRTMNTIPLKFEGAYRNFLDQNLEMEHFIGWAEAITELRAFFYHPDVKEAIAQLHHENINRWMKTQLDDFARGRINQQMLNHGLEKLRQNFAVAGLSRASVLLKQVTSLPAYAMRMPLGDFVRYSLEYIATNPIKNWHYMYERSVYLQERYDALGVERDISYFQERVREHPESRIYGAANWMLKAIAAMDATVNSPGMWAAYKSELKRTGNEQLAIENIATVTEATQSTSRLSSLTSFQRGDTFMRLLTQFQNNEAKYWQEAASTVRNLYRQQLVNQGRVDRATVLKNIIILWVVLPCLFQWMTDAFKVKKEHLVPTMVLGPIQNMLVLGELFEVIGDRWIGQSLGEEHFFDWNLFPMESVTKDVERVIDELYDVFTETTMENVVDLLEQMGKSSGYVLGLPTPYIAQAVDALRLHRWPETLQQLLWSKWSLYEGEPTPEERRQEATKMQQALTDAYDRLGTVLPVERELLPGEPEPPMPHFTMSNLRSEYNTLLKKVDPTQVTPANGYSPVVVSYNEMSQALAQLIMLPNVEPYKINADPGMGFTFENWMDVWEARLRIDDPKLLAEYDDTWEKAAVDGNFTWGNLTRRQADLLRQYHALEDDDAAEAFLAAHPEIRNNAREEWLRSHPQENALLALWGQGDLQTIEAYRALRQMVDTMDIPESALIKVPPEAVAEPYFKWKEYDEMGLTALSAETKLLRLQNPAFDRWMHDNHNWVLASAQEGPSWNPITLQIDIEWREQDEAYSNLPNTDYARTMYLLENPKYAEARWTREAYDKGFSAAWVDDYVEYRQAIDLRGTDRKSYLYQHQDFYREASRVLGWAPIDFVPSIPSQRVFAAPEPPQAPAGFYGAKW